jgi:hypothetical protein
MEDMMRTLLKMLLVVLLSSAASAQELLLTPKGESPAVVTQVTDATDEGDKKDESKDTKRKPGEIIVSTVLEGLNNPFAISIEDGSDRIFIAESGAQRVIEVKEGKAIEIAGQFPPSTYRGYQVGPLSLFAAGQSVLLVGHDTEKGIGAITKLVARSNKEDKSEDSKQEAAIEKDKRETIEIVNEGGAKLHQFSNLTVKHTTVYVVTHGDEENGWIAISEIQDGKLTTLRPSIPTAKRTSYPGPTCTAVDPGGQYLVVSQMGQENDAKDSRLVFYTLQGKVLNNFEVELRDIVSLAYSPSRKHLFAIDYNFTDPSKGGLYKLIGSDVNKCKVKKLQDLGYATAMQFDSKGTLWITSLGGPPATNGKPNGKLIKIEGLDDIPIEEDSESNDDSDSGEIGQGEGEKETA